MWERIDTTKKLRNVGGSDPNLYIEKRVYGENGNLWPRLTLSIYKFSHEDGFRIAANIKRDTKSWWEETSIPFELKSEILDMVCDNPTEGS